MSTEKYIDVTPNVNQEIVEALIKHYDLGKDADVDTLVTYLGGILKALGTFIRKEERLLEQQEQDMEDKEAERDLYDNVAADVDSYLAGKRDVLHNLRNTQGTYSNHLLCILAGGVTVKNLYLEDTDA